MKTTLMNSNGLYLKTVAVIAVYSLAGLLLVSCNAKNPLQGLQVEVTDSDSQSLAMSKFDINQNPLNKVVCDPWGGEEPPALDKGIKASLFYRGVGVPRFYSAQEYVDHATPSSRLLFFTDLNVPTRMFSEGFATQTSAVVKDDMGEKLIEFFGLKFETVLKLRADQEEGSYELSVLADDGVIVKAKIGGVWQEIISNDGDHPTKMGCANSTIQMSRDSAIPLEITYYQGPRYHISNVLMWRKSATAGSDALCGNLGNNLYFDPNNGSAPQQAYRDLLARTWEPISADNFYLPGERTYNPCVEGTDPVISDFRMTEVLSNDAYLKWTTDIPATTQVLVTKISTGEQTLTSADNLLRTSHSVHISGLEAGVAYKAQAISISSDMGKSLSSELFFTTLF